MTEEARRDWLAVAWRTLGDLPADLLSMGCDEARRSCDHPSKLVPAIIEATKQAMRWRRDAFRQSGETKALPSQSYVTAEQAAQILAEYGLKSSGDDEAPQAAVGGG